MNLYELAHHPEAWNVNQLGNNEQEVNHCWFGHADNSTMKQFYMLIELHENVANHTDENEFRMHLLFVYFATTDEKEWP
jgi:hypothetical protein